MTRNPQENDRLAEIRYRLAHAMSINDASVRWLVDQLTAAQAELAAAHHVIRAARHYRDFFAQRSPGKMAPDLGKLTAYLDHILAEYDRNHPPAQEPAT